MAKPYCSDLKIIQQLFNAQIFAVYMAHFNLAQLILLKKFHLL